MDTEFAYWVPNVSGGLVVSDWETETDWTYDYNLDLARTAAESVGFDYALAQARFFGSYGADKQLEALSIANALAAQTDERRATRDRRGPPRAVGARPAGELHRHVRPHQQRTVLDQHRLRLV